MKTWNLLPLRLALFVLIAAGMLSAVAAQIHRAPRGAIAAIDDTPMEPLPGRDFSMRVDGPRSRMQFLAADARIDAIAPLGRDDALLTKLEPGLWLAVAQPRADGKVDVLLQPMGATSPRRTDALRLGDSVSTSLRARLIERGGGVIFVDVGTAK